MEITVSLNCFSENIETYLKNIDIVANLSELEANKCIYIHFSHVYAPMTFSVFILIFHPILHFFLWQFNTATHTEIHHHTCTRLQ